MKKRIQHIIRIALIANLGLICFQAYWLYSNYSVNQKDFEKEIQASLEKGVEKMMFGKTRSIILKGSDSVDQVNIKIISDSSGFDILEYPPPMPKDTHGQQYTIAAIMEVSDSNKSPIKRKSKLEVMHPEVGNFLPEAEGLMQKVFSSLITANIKLDVLDSLVQEELDKRLLKTKFGLELFQQDSLLESSYSTGPFPVAYTKRVGKGILPPQYRIQANFPRQTLFLLKKMGSAIFVSFLLVSIMLWSFWYLLRVIFQQKKLAEIKTDFINNMTHELKTPISILSTANEALLNFDALDDRKKTMRYLGIFQKELERLTTMVEKVLRISIYEKDSFSLKKERINLEEMITGLVNQHGIPRDKPIQIEFDNLLKDPFVNVDKMHFYNVLSNLFDNAIKYAKEEIAIKITAEERNNLLTLKVQDRGIGISKAHQKSIFEQFYRVPMGNLHNVKGFGLGLSYVKKIIEKHDGIIQLQSELQKGSTFTIQIPKV